VKPAKSTRTTRQIVRGVSMYRGTASLDALPETLQRARPKAPKSRRGQVVWPLAIALFVALAAGSAWFGRHAIARGISSLELGRARVTVSGNEYLSPDEVRVASGLPERVSFFRVDLDKAGTRLLKNRRVLEARISRRLDGEVRIDITERVPVALALYSKPVEIAADGTLLPPLVSGVLPDLPVVTGLSWPQSTKVTDPDWARAVRWVHRLDDPSLALAGRVSEIDVSDGATTTVVLAPRGTRILLPAESREADGLGAVRVVLADLQTRNIEAATIDCRARGLAVVQPVKGEGSTKGDAKTDSKSKAMTGAVSTGSIPRVTQEHEASGSPERRRG
jgi:cell division septal protein FtsQ